MNRDGLGKIRRTELLARLEALDQQVGAQRARVRHFSERGWNVDTSEKRLKLLLESQSLYRSVLVHLLGDQLSADDEP